MADAPVVNIGENSPEQVAYKLFNHIADVENKRLYQATSGEKQMPIASGFSIPMQSAFSRLRLSLTGQNNFRISS